MNPEILGESWSVQLGLIFSVLSLRALILAGGSSLWLRFPKWAADKKIIKGKNEFKNYLTQITKGFLILFFDTSVAVLLIQTGVFRFSPAGFISSVATVLLLFVWVEIYFYYSHRLLHHPKLFWIHRHHHQAMVMNPWTSLSFSFLERGILLFGVTLLPAIFSQWIAFPLQAYTAYFLINYIMNVFGHLNAEVVPQTFVKSSFGKFFFTPTYHALHHIRYKGHFGLFTSALDKLHGTYFKDYEAVHMKNSEMSA